MEWIREWTDSDTHPQMLAAGFWGREVFRCLCRLSGKHDLNGRLPASMLEPRFLARLMGAGEVAEALGDGVEVCHEGVTACHDAGLLTPDPEGGGAIIPGWEAHQERAQTAAERQRKRREKLKMSRSVTARHAESRLEKSKEQSRVEKNKDSAAAPQLALVEPDVQDVFAYWRERTGGGGPEKPGKQQASHIRARLREGRTTADLKRVVDGALADIKNWPGRVGQLGVHILFRGDDSVRKFMILSDFPRGVPQATARGSSTL